MAAMEELHCSMGSHQAKEHETCEMYVFSGTIMGRRIAKVCTETFSISLHVF